jgi:hypothetical protein
MYMSTLKEKLSSKGLESRLSLIAIVYFMAGVIFAGFFAWYYHWPFVGYFSPGFYMVIFSWPYQAIGLIKDISFYGVTYPVLQ